MKARSNSENILGGFLKKNYYVFFIVLFYSVFHFFIKPDYWDDATYMKDLGRFGYNIFTYTSYRYHAGSSRIFVEICLSIIAALPNIIWKIADVLMIALLYLQLDYFSEYALFVKGKGRATLLALLVCAYPFSAMASAGWMATTTNYLWVLALGMYAINRIVKVAVYQKTLSAAEHVCMVLAILYSASYELMAAILFLAVTAAIVYQRVKKEKTPFILWVVMAIVILLLVYIACCPGNRNRILSDAENWMPEYFQLYILDKIRMGMVTAFLHFVSIPSAIFFLFSCLCFWGTVFKTKEVYKRVIALFPAVIDIFWSTYYLLSYFRGENVMTYQAPAPLLGGADTLEQIALLITFTVWLAAVICALRWNFEENRTFWCCLLLLGVGCAPELIIGFTPTVIASMLRTTIYLYLVMILIILCMWENVSDDLKKNKPVRVFLYAVIGAGILLNAIQITRHILVYG